MFRNINKVGIKKIEPMNGKTDMLQNITSKFFGIEAIATGD